MPQSSKGQFHKRHESRPLLGTVVRLEVCYRRGEGGNLDQAYAQAWLRLEEINMRMNVYNDSSEVARINRSWPESIVVPDDVYEVLRRSAEYFVKTRGAFDITVWPLMRLWKEGEGQGVVPSRVELETVLQTMGVDKIELLAGNRVRLGHAQTKIDLNGIAAGFAADEAVRVFRSFGLVNVFVDAGGEISAGGHSCSGRPWRVAIADPRGNTFLPDVVELQDAGISTSGDYAQFFEIGGQRWSKIINPLTGIPQKDVVSSTVIAPDATAADALSTALCVLGPAAGTSLIDRLGPGFASLLILKDEQGRLQIHRSRLWRQFTPKNGRRDVGL